MKLLITRKVPDTALEILSKFPEIEIDYRKGVPLTKPELLHAIKGVNAVIPVIPDQIDADIVKAGSPTLRLIACYAVGFDNIDLETATKNGVYVANTPGNLTESVAEFTLGLMFTLAKNMVAADQFVRQGKYKFWDPLSFLGTNMLSKKLGIVGMGRIGYYLAQMAHKGLNMEILYADRNINKDAEMTVNAKHQQLEELLGNSDFVALTCPLTKETHHLINEHRLKLMKPTAYLINTARGPIVDESALYTALKEGWIQGAALDVFEKEPNLHAGLKDLTNVVVTPHIASATREARIQMAVMAVQNVIDVLIHNKAPQNLVNKELEICVTSVR